MSFLVSEASMRLARNGLVQLVGMIDWEGLRQTMGRLGRSGYGPSGYDSLKMLKALVLQAWHSLSDPGLEEALRVRLDFMVITGFSSSIPDETTLCRFRNKLMQQGLLDKLLAEINQQLETKGLKVKASQGAILDATIIKSAARPRKEIELMPVDRQEEEAIDRLQATLTLSKDPGATWLKKGNKSYFGYKGFITTDAEDGYINHVHTKPAHVSETREFANIVPFLKGRRTYADKGFASAENKALLQKYGIKNGIMEKARRNKPLSSTQKRFNRLISKPRYKVEQAFGTLKRRFNFERASYMTIPKVHGQMVLKAIAFNLLKALNKYCLRRHVPPVCL